MKTKTSKRYLFPSKLRVEARQIYCAIGSVAIRAEGVSINHYINANPTMLLLQSDVKLKYTLSLTEQPILYPCVQFSNGGIMNITLTLNNKSRRIYDLTLETDAIQFKSIITRAINKKNIDRLTEAERQLVNVNDNSVATEQLKRIQVFLASQKPEVSIKPQMVESQFATEDVEDCKNEFPNKPLITNVHLYPRSEYYTRFVGTTAFDMHEPAYYGTYHRSESNRCFSIAGGRKNAQFTSPCVKKAQKTHSFFAHTGGFHPPFAIGEYRNDFGLEKQVPEGTGNIRDQLLLYKNRMAKVVVASFSRLEKNEQETMMHNVRPIVYAENDYPCVLVNLPALNPVVSKTEATRYWAKHPKPFQRLLQCSFIALLNVEAMLANIPIEMVLRASFGHNLPSVCETNNTFRINIGVIPKCYAELIGKALHLLNKHINAIEDTTLPTALFDAKFLAQTRIYNARKLKEKISKNDRYKELRNTRDFQKAERSYEAFERLYSRFCDANKGKSTKNSSRFQPVILECKTVWEFIRQAGDSMGKSVLDECFRQKGTEDWFANKVMEALLIYSTNPIETALSELLKCITYNEKVTMNYEKIRNDLNEPKRFFTSLSFESIYKDDPDFSEITSILFEGLCAKRPNNALYSELERAGINFFTKARGNQDIQEESDYGSDSECECELTDEETSERSHMSHKKLRCCSGMKAIVLAQYGALSYFRTQKITCYWQDIQQMYYEVENALRLVDVEKPVINKVRSTPESNILHFDLNHCNATNSADNQTLREKLDALSPAIVILDYTSAITLAVKEALQRCFSKENVKLVMLVDSGLKNNQGGLDINPYGEVRICARNMETVNKVRDIIRKGLSEQDKLNPKAHEKVRACKRRGMAFSLLGLLKTGKSRFQATRLQKQRNRISKLPQNVVNIQPTIP